MAIWLQTSIWENRLKTMYLIFLMFFLVFVGIFLGVWMILQDYPFSTVVSNAFMTYIWAIPIIIIWLLISIYFHKNIIFHLTKTKTLERKTSPEIYNIVENLCISRGLPMVKIGIIEDESLNAFATGWDEKNSYIAFSRGLLKKLNKQEIEAVAAHELTHIINRDVRIMLLANIFVWIIATIWYFLMRIWSANGKNSSKKWWDPFLILGFILYILWIIILPFIQFAISRKREYLADAWSVELTKNKDALISALQKISQDSFIEGSDSSVSAMFIHTPKDPSSWNIQKRSHINIFHDLFSTHPPIALRIQALEKY